MTFALYYFKIFYAEISSEGNIILKIIIPILEMIKEKSPNVAVNSDILSPLANISGVGLPIASTESKAEIKPITDPKNPITKANKLKSTASFKDL